MKKWIFRISLMLFILGGTALFVASNHYNLISLERAVCKAEQTNLQIPVDDFITDYQGSSILDFPAEKYLDSIFMNYPQIEKASLVKSFTGILALDYDLKQPCVLVHLDKIYGLTRRAELVPASGYNYPIITGIKIRHPKLYQRLNNRSVMYALKIADIISSFDNDLINKISTVNLGHASGLSLNLEGCPAELILGRGDELLKFRKINRLQKFLCNLDRDILAIDFRFSNQIILKKIL